MKKTTEEKTAAGSVLIGGGSRKFIEKSPLHSVGILVLPGLKEGWGEVA